MCPGTDAFTKDAMTAAPPLFITWACNWPMRLVGNQPSPQVLIRMSFDTVLSRHLDSDKQNTRQHQKAPTLCIASINQGNMT